MSRFDEIDEARAGVTRTSRYRLTLRKSRALLPALSSFIPAECFKVGQSVGGLSIIYVGEELRAAMAGLSEKELPAVEYQSLDIHRSSTDTELAGAIGHASRLQSSFARAYQLMELSSTEPACIAPIATNWVYVVANQPKLTPLLFWRSRGGWMISAATFDEGLRTGVLHLPPGS